MRHESEIEASRKGRRQTTEMVGPVKKAREEEQLKKSMMKIS